MTITSDPNLWVICALVFLLGVFVGVFLTAGGRRKWRARHREEVTRREALEREHERHLKDAEAREKEWRERDSLRGAAIKDRDGDGVRDDREM
jgi:C4-dicarboxylate-specific signal transduction histidine kinase